MSSELNIQIEDLISKGAADFEISKVFKTFKICIKLVTYVKLLKPF